MEIQCHCGAVRQTLLPRTAETGLTICHCNACRHATGLLCTSYASVQTPPSLDGMRSYSLGGTWALWFCATCGCHVFRCAGGEGWEVATGVVSGVDDDGQQESRIESRFCGHMGVEDTVDGGISIWLEEIAGHRLAVLKKEEGLTSNAPRAQDHYQQKWSLPDEEPSDEDQGQARLQASCHCGGVRFYITRPDTSSQDPTSDFPDLLIPYVSNDPRIKNPDNVKWWLRQNQTKYLAGTCACRSCRLVSGFEIQTWTFIPRSNIFFHVVGSGGNFGRSQPSLGSAAPLDFSVVHSVGVLQAYESSPGVIREFCPHCGATVFWHDKWRPELIDTSVGLLDAREGARAESWLDWCHDRVSFEEDASLDRAGASGRWARDLVSALEARLRDTKHE